MANNFITNNKDKQKTLKGRIKNLFKLSEELKFLVGFFYFSGWHELYQSLKERPDLRLKLLVGLQVDKLLGKMVEHGNQPGDLSQEEKFQQFMSSMGLAINNEEMDTEEFYNQVGFFLEMLENGRLQIRKTDEPNHAKLYLFRYKKELGEGLAKTGEFITGSSNLTRAGLEGQHEFNVEISDYGFEDAEAYFDELWEKSVPITEFDDRRKFLIEFIKHKSQAATVTPFEAYILILKTYLDLQEQKHIKPEVERLLEENGFQKFNYQTDAVNQALKIIEEYGGVVIADVAGLGKSVIAALIAKNLGKRGLIICPPGLIGDKHENTGWWEYRNRFNLYDWEIESRGKLEDLAESLSKDDCGFEVILIDEAHYFRNQDTEAYEALMNVCRNKIVILLTATPFNNSPADIFSLLKLFIVPGKSGITVEENLEATFRAHDYRFGKLSDIQKYYNSKTPSKRAKAENTYRKLFNLQPPIDIQLVRDETRKIANQIKEIISPIVIRRNRLDLKTDFEYSREVGQLSRVKDPQELYFELDPNQSKFYDQIINDYFGEDGLFNGAIYQPFIYEKKVQDEDQLDEEGNRQLQQQQNLFDFMRRLIVKRFESSFGAFSQTIERFLQIHKVVQQFIANSGGKYILDRKLIEAIYQSDEEDIGIALDEFEILLSEKKTPKNNRVYKVNDFERKDEFLADIEKDRQLFEMIKLQIKQLDLVKNDPKRQKILEQVIDVLEKEPNRKVILFSEYVDTVKHLEPFFRKHFGKRVLVCDGKVSKELHLALNESFNAQYKGMYADQYDVLITSDKLSEGFNLNRAGAIINYDIPWNPTRVIQRVGRINRIGAKVFDELYIFNFFPSEKGADIVKSREIAEQKMFLIHNSLGEDSKIFHPDEEPSPSALFKRMNENPENEDELSISTIIRNRFEEIRNQYPELVQKISQLPARVKSAKIFEQNQINVLRKKGLSLFVQQIANPEDSKSKIESVLIENLLPLIECNVEEPVQKLSSYFWPAYQQIKTYRPPQRSATSEASVEVKANNNLKYALKVTNPADEELRDFIQTLLKDLRNYHTLPKYTLRRLSSITMGDKTSRKDQDKFFAEVRWIRNHLGRDYLERILKRVENQNLEVIIAVENRTLSQ
jgi:superfamily II DNA/RNA helicase